MRASLTLPDWYLLNLAKVFAAAAVAYWLGMSIALQTLLGLMALDIITGIIAGIFHQQLSSKTASKGMARKAGSLIIIFAVHLVSDQAGNHIGFPLPVDLGNVVAWFYVLTEWISVTENCAKLGAPIPKRLLNALQRARELQDTETAMADVKSNQADATVSLEKATESLDKAHKATEALEQALPGKTD